MGDMSSGKGGRGGKKAGSASKATARAAAERDQQARGLTQSQQATVDAMQDTVRDNVFQTGSAFNEQASRKILTEYVKTGKIPQGDLFYSQMHGEKLLRRGDEILTVESKKGETGQVVKRRKISTIPKAERDQLIQLHAVGASRRGYRQG